MLQTNGFSQELPHFFALIKEYSAYYEVWIRTVSGAHQIIRFREQANALALIDTMKSTMNIVVEQTDLISLSIKDIPSLPPESGRYI